MRLTFNEAGFDDAAREALGKPRDDVPEEDVESDRDESRERLLFLDLERGPRAAIGARRRYGSSRLTSHGHERARHARVPRAEIGSEAHAPHPMPLPSVPSSGDPRFLAPPAVSMVVFAWLSPAAAVEFSRR